MSFIGDFLGDTFGGLTGAKQAGKAAEKAGDLQYKAAMSGVDEQKRQFDKLVELMTPYVSAGKGAMSAQQDLLGLGKPGAQDAAIAAIEGSPQFASLLEQGENALLQNASATGGLRGGNLQGALAQFRPQILSSLIEQQYSRLGGLTQVGQASAAGQAAAGMQSGSDIANLLANAAQAKAGGILAKGAVPGQTFGSLLKVGGAIAGAF